MAASVTNHALAEEGELVRGRLAEIAAPTLGERGCPARAGLRLYRATADAHWILAKDGLPDHRIPAPLR